MRPSSPSPNENLREDLEQLYLRRVALDRVIRSLEDYRQKFVKMPVRAAGHAQGAVPSFERMAS